ncbi:uracil-DNA glycosylase [Duganella zoogloeoides]|uniref:Uracil-DNA glycosylase n=1 Tax=Duganella zoogloeoides TaxID=75659 RepID=A0ABZ0Y286_9BURK|nr:uracil-DNA glycosylase [Duganella zoogloeoides]WQH06151.1 uracil-DNA glycosylase [Duganella zoogloeoides]
MSVSPRNAVFLQEMGVGALWTLRHAGTALAPGDGADAAAAGVADQHQGMDVPVAAMPGAPTAPARPPLPAATAAAPAPAVADAAAAAPSPAHEASPAHGHTPAQVPASAHASGPAPVSAPLPARHPATSPVVASDDESTAWFDDVPAATPPPPRPRPTQPAQPVTDEAIAAMDWPALQSAVSNCTRCPLAATRRHAVNGRGPEQAAWLAIATGPSALDETEIRPLAGDAGQLLDNMFKAIALKPEADVYITHLVKCRPATDDGAQRNPTADELTACRPYLDRELALTGATMAMTFGQFAAKGLMMGPAARGKVMRYGDLPVVATYHPDDLLARPEDKAKAWGDLCLARTARD